MITKVNNSITNLKNLFIEIFLDKTNKVTNIADGSVLNAVAFGAAKVAQKAIKDIAITEAKIFPETATGDFLDKAAALYGVAPRKGALGSSTYVRVYAKPGTVYGFDNFFINKNGIRFSVDEEVTVNSTGYAYVKVRSVNAGYTTNVSANSITNITPIPDGHIECTNEYMATGGRDSEDDETFRLRIKTNLNILSKGTLEYFTQVYQSLDDRILRVMNAGLGEDGIYEIYLVTQNGIYLTEDELTSLLEQSKSYFGLSELNLQGDVIGIRLKNVEWFYIGSERGIDFRVELNPNYEIADVRKNIQVGITKYLDFRFWETGKIIQWDDLLDVVKKTEGVKYVPDEYFFPYYDQQVPLNQLPRIKGFVMRDLDGRVLYDSGSTLSPMFYPKDEDDLFKGLSDTSLSLKQQASFFVRDEEGNVVEGARVTVGTSSVLTDSGGKATISLINGTYNYSIVKDKYETIQGSFVVLNGPITINTVLIFAPYTAYFTVTDERDNPIEDAKILLDNTNEYATNINGEASILLKVGSYRYNISKLGYKDVEGEIVITDSDIYVPITMRDQEFVQTIFVRDDVTKNSIVGSIVSVNNNSYVTDEDGRVDVKLINGTYRAEITMVGYNSVQETIKVNNAANTIVVELSAIKYNISIVALNNEQLPISGAKVSINDGDYVLYTAINGKAVFQLINGTYDVTITSKDYESVTTSFQIQYSDMELEYTMEDKHYDVTIIVLDSNNSPVQNAIVTLGENSLLTNESGSVVFSLINGTYSYKVAKLGYYDKESSLEVNRSEVSTIVNLISFPWDITIVVKSGETLLSDVTLVIDSNKYITDEEGKVNLSLINGTYSYSATKLGYTDISGEFIVDNKSTTVNLAMELKPYTVTFTVISRGKYISDAKITCEGMSVTTNSQGVAELGLVNGVHNYTVTKTGYIDYEGTITINNEDQRVVVDFEPIIYTVVFNVTDNNSIKNPVSSVTISVGGETVLTDTNGQATVQLPSGTYTAVFSKTGYLETSSIIDISSATTIDQIIDQIYKLSFVVTGSDGAVLSNALIVVTGDAVVPDTPTSEKKKTLITDSEGKTSSIDVINGTCSYGANHSGYSSQEGILTIQDSDLIQEITLTYGLKTTFLVKDQFDNLVSEAIISVDSTSIKETDSEGLALFYLANGEHSYTVTKAGYQGVSGLITVNDEEQTIDVVMQLGAKVTFTSALNGNVLQGMTVVVKDSSSSSIIAQGTTDNQGKYVVQLPSGSYTVSCGDNETNYATYNQDITVGTEESSFNFEMNPYIYYNLTVTTNYKTVNIEGASVRVYGVVNNVSYDQTIQTSSSGQALFTKIINGDYSVEITKDGYQDYSGSLTVSGNTSTTLNINKYSSVTLTCVNYTGTVIEGIDVTFNGTTKTTNSSGQVTFSNILDGEYTAVVAAKDKYKETSIDIIVSGEDIVQEVTVVSSYIATITVQDAQGDIVPNITVIVKQDNIQVASGTTNDSGKLSIELNSSTVDYTANISPTSDFSAGDDVTFSIGTEDTVVTVLCNFVLHFSVTVRQNTTSGTLLSNVAVQALEAGATIGTYTTNSNGVATWDSIYGKSSYGYNIAATSSYKAASGTFTVSKSSHSVSLTAVVIGLFTVTINVKRSGANQSGVSVALVSSDSTYSNTLSTNSSGNVVFSGVPYLTTTSAVYKYSVTGGNYWTAISSTSIGNVSSNTTKNISLTPLYDLKFNPGVASVSIVVSGVVSGTYTTGTDGTITINKVASGSVSYTASKDGYESITGTVTLEGTSTIITESFTMTESNPYVFIQATDGTLVKPSAWASSGKTANCIAVVTENAKFGIALSDANSGSNMTWISSDRSTVIPSVFINSNESIALTDYSGQANSKTLYQYNTGYTSVASVTKAFTFPNNKKGYCGSFGEWQVAYDNKSAIVSAMSTAGGTAIREDYYWTSTQYSGNNSWSLTWSDGNRGSFNKVYNRYVRAFVHLYSKGIYIQGTDGNLYTTSAWSSRPSGVSANCIAVIGDDIEFGIALQDAYSTYCTWGGRGTTISNIYTNTTASNASSNDFGGFANTYQIINQLGASNAPAANYCNTFTFPNGKKGYLGSMGEWYYAYQNKSAITSAMSTAGGTAIREDYYWTSTQYSSNNSWYLYWSDGNRLNNTKNRNIYVRAFVHL